MSSAQREIFPILSWFGEERFLTEFILSIAEGFEKTCGVSQVRLTFAESSTLRTSLDDVEGREQSIGIMTTWAFLYAVA
jgi:hypothetical protein